MEEYRTIIEFPNYQVSNFGNIKNIKKNVLMSTYLKKNGYTVVKLSKEGKAFECKIHRLVATAFIDNPVFNKIHISKREAIKIVN